MVASNEAEGTTSPPRQGGGHEACGGGALGMGSWREFTWAWASWLGWRSEAEAAAADGRAQAPQQLATQEAEDDTPLALCDALSGQERGELGGAEACASGEGEGARDARVDGAVECSTGEERPTVAAAAPRALEDAGTGGAGADEPRGPAAEGRLRACSHATRVGDSAASGAGESRTARAPGSEPLPARVQPSEDVPAGRSAATVEGSPLPADGKPKPKLPRRFAAVRAHAVAAAPEAAGNADVAAALQSEWFAQLKRCAALRFDTGRCALGPAVAAVVSAALRALRAPRSAAAAPPPPRGAAEELCLADLCRLHLLTSPQELKQLKRGKWMAEAMDPAQGPAGAALRDLYHRFVCEFAAPLVAQWAAGPGAAGQQEGPPQDPHLHQVVFQASPCLRIQPPSANRMGHPHCDSMYMHQRGQINLWMPITTVYGNNSLWLESEPGRGDFHPLELEYGQVARFYGNKCTHFTQANDTGHTRVSLDLRVVPGPCFDPHAPESLNSDGRPRFFVGEYYARAVRDPATGAWAVVDY